MKNHFICIVILCIFFMASDCFAHKITVFGYVDQGLVKTESMFSGGRVAQNCTLSITGDAGPILIGKTDEKGLLDFPISGQKDGFDLVVVCGDGHRGSWRIEANEFLEVPELVKVSSEQEQAVSVPTSVTTPENTDLRQMIREELSAELGPIKRQLAMLKQDKVSIADIMGGLGYFLGLAGLASYMRYRRHGK